MSEGAGSAVALRARLEAYYAPQPYARLVRAHLHLGSIDDVEEAIQDAILRVYARFVDGGHPEPDNLDAFLNRAIRNRLIDRLRGPKREFTPNAEDERSESSDAEEAFWSKTLERQIGPGIIGAPIEPEQQLAWKQLYAAVLDRLPTKYADIAAMVMLDASPGEIGAAFGQNGYGLRAYTRDLIAKILADLSAGGDANAGVLLHEMELGPGERSGT